MDIQSKDRLLYTYLTCCIFSDSTNNPLNSFNPDFQFHVLSPRRRGSGEADGTASVGQVHSSTTLLGIPVQWTSNQTPIVLWHLHEAYVIPTSTQHTKRPVQMLLSRRN
jgi:hypothetical protein